MKSLFRFLNVLPRSKEEKVAQLTCELVNANNEAEKLRDEKEKISKAFKKLSVSMNNLGLWRTRTVKVIRCSNISHKTRKSLLTVVLLVIVLDHLERKHNPGRYI